MSTMAKVGSLAIFAVAGIACSGEAQAQVYVQDIAFKLDEGGNPVEYEELAPERLAADNWQLRAELEMMREREAAAQRRIADLEERLLRLEQVAGLVGAQRLSDAEEAQMRGQGFGTNVMAPIYRGNQIELTRGNPNFVQTTPQQDGEAQQTEEYSGRRDPAPSQSVEAVTEEQQGYFGRRFSFEGGVNYSHFDDARINLSGFLALDAIFLGQISVDEQTSDVITTDFTGRFAPNDRLQFDVNVPTIYRSSVFQSGGVGGDASGLADARVDEFGLGDVSVGASYRLLRETVRRPDVVINTRVKAPTGKDPFGIELVEVEGTEGNFQIPTSLSTGSGAWAASAGVSALKTLDPMIVFGNVTYFHNFKNEFDDIDETPGEQPGTVDIGNAIQFGAGLAFALNEKSSISTSFSVRFGDEARLRFEGEEFEEVVGSGSTVGMLNLGATFAVSNRVSLLANVGVGMTTDAPDMVLSVRVPFRF
ncbi:transporter [Erythrobacter sp. THAF29]|uniref:transporter n=1 Tax=Erythrobacter sp. THAF29 TaxID=2587851 RepID=UPI0012682340|nr:transporter [Erythrobacter sp. THAF29]QFT76463.1 hypothetical protein FIU90_02795 [Erythrobacter sp. THAF29]